jgi:uncharacterized coiled-coil protein SlyX
MYKSKTADELELKITQQDEVIRDLATQLGAAKQLSDNLHKDLKLANKPSMTSEQWDEIQDCIYETVESQLSDIEDNDIDISLGIDYDNTINIESYSVQGYFIESLSRRIQGEILDNHLRIISSIENED